MLRQETYLIIIGYKARNSYELWALSYEMARFICHEYMCVYVAVFKWLELTMIFRRKWGSLAELQKRWKV